MLDVKLLRANPEGLRDKILAKNGDPARLDALLEADTRYRKVLTEVESLRAERARGSEEVGRLRKAGQDAALQQATVREVGERLKMMEDQLPPLEALVQESLHWIPNLPHDSVPIGDETHNALHSSWGEPIRHPFPVKPHHEIGEELGLIDMAGGARMSGSGFSVLKGEGALLERALINFFLTLHVTEHGYTEVAAPFLVKRASLFGTGQLPKLEEDMYLSNLDDLFLIPTAEVSITNLHREEILEASRLPTRYVGYSPCFRREAGSAGKETRGLTRVHQFSKVEMVRIVTPETSYVEHEALLANAETVLQRLGLPYRVLLLASGDTSFAAAKCYDLEVWAPGAERWLEVSSCSNFEAFQARRLDLRYRPAGGGKPQFVHTLNASGLALPRTIIAILENYQTERGTIRVPDVLVPFMGGRTEIGSRT